MILQWWMLHEIRQQWLFVRRSLSLFSHTSRIGNPRISHIRDPIFPFGKSLEYFTYVKFYIPIWASHFSQLSANASNETHHFSPITRNTWDLIFPKSKPFSIWEMEKNWGHILPMSCIWDYESLLRQNIKNRFSEGISESMRYFQGNVPCLNLHPSFMNPTIQDFEGKTQEKDILQSWEWTYIACARVEK